MRVVGTAGHVDHGKSALVKALTGINPDRLREEQERQMTIDLGFAWLELPGGEELGIVDVPGHRDFIENMLAGVGGIDAALLVIAADEGIMPQTREHLAIIDLLRIPKGVIALTKCDLVDDDEWIELVSEDIRSLVEGTVLADAPIIPVSAQTGSGLERLVDEIEMTLGEIEGRNDDGRPRLSIDRVFSIAGFGTIVTGTLVDGPLRVGDEIMVLPQDLHGRIRGLQTHKTSIQEAIPGSRVAVNVSGVDVPDIRRGDTLVHPGAYLSTRLMDVHFELLSGAPDPVKHNQEVKLFVGAAQRVARIRLLGTSVINPGEEGWLQLELQVPIVAARGDRYILRRPSPPSTIGGGVVVDPHPGKRHRRKNQKVIERLEGFLVGDPQDVIVQTLRGIGPMQWSTLNRSVRLDEDELNDAVKIALENGSVHRIGGGATETFFMDDESWKQLSDRLISTVEAFHSDKPLRSGMSIDELRSKLSLDLKITNSAIEAASQQGLLERRGRIVRGPGYVPRLSPDQKAQVQNLMERFEASPFATPSVKESKAAVGEAVYEYLVSSEGLIEVSNDVVFRDEDYAGMVDEVQRFVNAEGKISIAEARDHFGTSRKYVLALLEHLDELGVTVREGDYRKLSSGAS